MVATPARRRLRPGGRHGLGRVHVGSGPMHRPDWWNVDIRAFPGAVDEIVDAAEPWPWRGLEFVYGEHFLEHLAPDAAIRFVREAARALAPGGVLRLSTPSLEHVWVTHFHPTRDRPKEIAIRETYAANRAFHGWGHRFLYSREMLERVLADSGFTDITFHGFGESDREALRGLEWHAGGEAVADGWPAVWIVEGAAADSRPDAPDLLLAEVESEFQRHVRSGH